MVLFKIDGGKRVPEIEMSLLDTILDLKQKIQELDVEVYRQRLWHKDRIVKVKFVGSDGYVEVKETDKVRDLCSKVERQWGIPSELIPLKRHDIVMEDHLPLSAYYVNEASEVQLSVLIEPR
ncbi:hypothetical protein glysoja_007928 [Glycine soja]|nr:hypothetical protein glysoja_007928 [Glycine soja]